MTEQPQEVTYDDSDPLAQAAENLEAPTYPLLAPDKIVRLEIVDSKIESAKDKPDFKMLVLKFKTTKDYPDREGKVLRSGFTSFQRITVVEIPETSDKRGRTNKNIAEELGMLLKAVGKKQTTPRDLLNNPGMLKDQLIDMRTGISKGRDGFPDSNTFKPYIPA